MAKLCEFKKMRKNGSRLISVQQYRLTDLFIFFAILVASELLEHFALQWFPSGAFFTFSLVVPISLLVMARWGWRGVFCPFVSALMFCLLNEATGTQYLTYCFGNAFIILMLLPFKFIGTGRISGKWYWTLLATLIGWALIYIGRSTVYAICFAASPVEGSAAYAGFVEFATYDGVSLAIAVILMLALRRLDGMFENQEEYLKRVDKERRDRMKRDEFGDEPIELDEETLSILNKHDDMY